MKTLVVAGASLGLSGCGGESRRTLEGEGGEAGGGGTAGSSGAAGTPVGGRAGAAATPVYTGNIEGCSSAQRVCTCTYEPSVSLSCTYRHPFGYYGDSTTSFKLTGMDCQCDAARPAKPEDCASTEQFTCAEYTPEYEACFCDPSAPRSADDCEGHRIFQCAGQDPIVGCFCVTPIK